MNSPTSTDKLTNNLLQQNTASLVDDKMLSTEDKYQGNKNIQWLMEQIFPLSFELVSDGQQLNIVAFDTQARIHNIQIAPVPAVAIVNFTNTNTTDASKVNAVNNVSNKQAAVVNDVDNIVDKGIIRKCYPPALIFDLYPINNKSLYRVVSESGAYDLAWFCFNCPSVTINYEHLPAVAVLLQFWGINPCGWLDYLPAAAPRQINNSLSPPNVNLSQLAASLQLHDFERRLKLANLWHCPVNVVDTSAQVYYFLTRYNPSLLAKPLPASLTMVLSTTLTPTTASRSTTAAKFAKRFTDSYVAEMFGIQNIFNKLTCNSDTNSDPCYYRLYRLIELGYYNANKLDVDKMITYNINSYNNKSSNNQPEESTAIYIRKAELLLPPPHLKSLVTKVRQNNLLAYCDIVVK